MSKYRRIALALALDIFSVLLFVAVGRRNHNESAGISGVVEVALPFLIALVCGWVLSRAWQKPDAIKNGVVIWLITVVLGLLLRNLIFGRGIATPFIIVATVVLGVLLVGRRLAMRVIR
ncbi:MAG: DUF3054 family protein [Actinobacteria bacterium]|uniref:Unannotated protein n=1 Tax=freshwater metagenome TaxID=449393 RepID=A0A6J6GGW4_9ZZZZ|nr:DUF3054 family protein [Actinomycetota bacterium]